MSDTVISVKNISKRYRIGVKEKTETFAQQFANLLAYPIKNLRRIASLNSFKDGEDPTVFWALKDINFEVKQGEVLGIIGRNGAGKSTLLKILSRITEPTSGQIEIRGRVSSLLEVGTGFHPELTGRDNVYMNGTILGMTKKEIDKKFDEIIDFSGIEKHIDTPVKFYSSGMTVRLAFSVAAHLEPEILIIDEVLAVGDAEFQKKCLGKMEDVAGQGRTVLFVSHNMAAVQSLCNQALLLKEGSKVKEGDVSDVVGYYLTSNSSDNKAIYKYAEENVHQVWINSASIKINDQVTNRVLSGQEMEIEFTYKAKEPNFQCALYIGVYNHYEDKILHLGSPYGGFETFKTETEGIIQCIIPDLPLPEGKYNINFSLHLNGNPHHRVQNALNLLVEYGDFYGNGKIPSSRESKFLVRQKWVLNNSKPVFQ